MTDKLYERDAYCRKFSAIVEECNFKNGCYCVILNQTAFFPEGGGQAADKGTINGISVLDVKQQDDFIVHLLESELKIGEEVLCEIDWDLRYGRMQGHSGEHILSGIVKMLFGYDNVGFHMGDDIMVVDFNGSLSKEDIEKIEINANKAIYMNADIIAYYPTIEEFKTLLFRSKIDISTGMRIVAIGEDIDCCACCAPHLAKTGEVGIIKVVDFYSYKQGTRIKMLAGINALKDYMNLNTYHKILMKMMSTPRYGVVNAVHEKNNAYHALRSDYQRISKRMALLELERIEIGGSLYSIADNLNFDELRYCANHLIDMGYDTCLLLSKNGMDGYIYVVNSKNYDVRMIAKELNDTLSGKGGGQRNYSQGKLGIFPEKRVKSIIEKILKKEV